MEKVYIARNEDIKPVFDANGYACVELLPGTYDGGIRNYKCFLKAGCDVSPEMYSDKTVLFFFGFGKGYITDSESAYNITEVAFYAPYFEKCPYRIHAVEDMEWVMSIVELNEWDKEVLKKSQTYLPMFKSYSNCSKYRQDCKGPHTESRNVLLPGQLGRVILGTVKAIGEGTIEKGHPAVHQWNYCLGNSDFNLIVDNGEPIRHVAGEFSFIPAGPDHSLVADSGKEVFYIWYEQYVREKDFIIKPLPGQNIPE